MHTELWRQWWSADDFEVVVLVKYCMKNINDSPVLQQTVPTEFGSSLPTDISDCESLELASNLLLSHPRL